MSINIPSILSGNVCLLTNLLGISSLTNTTPPPCLFLSRRYGYLKPSIINCESGKLESNLVSVITKMSTLFLIISFNRSNLLDSEFIFKWYTTDLFIFFSLISFKCSTVSQGSVFGQLQGLN